MKRRLVIATVTLATAAALVAALGACRSSEASCATAHQCLPGVTYEGLHREQYPPQELKGKTVVVNFWATWCAPCRKEIPAFNKVYDRYKDDGVVMLGVLHDYTVDDVALLNFMSDNEFTYPVVRADEEILAAYHYPRGLPTTFVYDRRGRLVTRHEGPMTEDQLAAALERALGR